MSVGRLRFCLSGQSASLHRLPNRRVETAPGACGWTRTTVRASHASGHPPPVPIVQPYWRTHPGNGQTNMTTRARESASCCSINTEEAPCLPTPNNSGPRRTRTVS